MVIGGVFSRNQRTNHNPFVTDLPSILARLVELTDEAGRLAQSYRGDLRSTLKPDGSIVTQADQGVERMLRGRLVELVPGTTIWGEEEGFETAGVGGVWLVDPIDGTSNFAYGSPLWGVSVALIQDGQIVLGVVSIPDLGETYSSHRGAGTSWSNDLVLPPIEPGPIRDEELVSFSDGLMRGNPMVVWPGKMRYSGAFVIDGCWVARGRLRGMVDYKCKLYDAAACILICQELGGEVRYANGDPFVVADVLFDRPIGRPFVIFPRDSGFVIP